MCHRLGGHLLQSNACGFLVSAEHRAGKVVKLEIVSTVGGKLRMLCPWTGKLVERETKRGEKLKMKP